MSFIILTIAYILAAVLQIVWLTMIIRRKKPQKFFAYLLGVQILCTAAAIYLTHLFNTLPGYGLMPGLTWLSHYIVSLAMIIFYALSSLVTLIIWLVKRHKAIEKKE